MTETLRGHAAMLTFSALIAGSFALGALAAPHIEPAALNAVRFIIAAAVVGTVASMTVGIPKRAFVASWRYLVLGGLMGIYFVMMFEGLKTAHPVSASAVFTLTPVLSGAFGYLLLKQIMTPRMAIALLVGVAGALWVIFKGDFNALARLDLGRGETIFFSGCIAHALYTPMVRKLNRGENPVIFSLGAIIAAAVLLIITGWQDIVGTSWSTLPNIVWITLFYTSVAATAVSFVLLQFASLRLPSAKVMAYTYLTPTWVIVWQVALGHALPPVWSLIGITLTILALILLLKDERTATHQGEDHSRPT